VSLWPRVYRERRAAILPLVVALVANVALLALVVLPLVHSVTSLQDEAQAAAFSLNKARLADREAQGARASKERADRELKKFYAEILPADFTGARRLVVLSFLQKTARDAGLTLQRSQADEEQVKDSQLERVTAKVTLAGDYQNIRKFLYAVETAPEFVVIERVALAQATDVRATGSGALEVTLDVATYYLAGAAGAGQ
jgi:Tfp pilus assembly protein PilO